MLGFGAAVLVSATLLSEPTVEEWQELKELPQVVYEARFVSAQFDPITKVGFDWQSVTVPSASGDRAKRIPETESLNATHSGVAKRLVMMTVLSDELDLESIARQPGSELVFAPNVTTFQGKEWSVSNVVERAFVVGQSSTGEAVIDVVEEGVTISARQTDVENDLVELTATWTEVAEVENVDVSRLVGSELTLQSPVVNDVTVTTASKLADGHTLVIGVREAERGRAAKNASWKLVLVTKRTLGVID